MGRGRRGSGVQPLKSCIRVRFTYGGKRCTETIYLEPTAANIKAAERLMTRVQREIELGVFDYKATFPSTNEAVLNGFTSYARNWLAHLTVEKSTLEGYRGAINEIWVPLFGERDIASIKPSEIKREIAKLARRVSGKTVNNTLIPLRGIFNAAIDDELLDRSPLANIRSLKHQSPKPDPFDREEMEAILLHLRTHYDEQVWTWYEFAFGTGLRPSEQIAVQWSDVDWKRGTVRIQRARVRAVMKSTKTALVRDVDLTDRMVAVLARQKAHSFERGPDSPIFINPVTGTPWPDVQDQRKLYFHPALRALGLRNREAYQTRHTYATLALMAGVNPAYIARQLGHVNAAMLFKHYAKWIDGADSGREAAKLNALFAR
jgi:integrase